MILVELIDIDKLYKNTWKEFDELKNIDGRYYSSDYYDVSLNKYGVKCKTSFIFWENKGWTLMDGFNGILGIISVEDL